MIRPQVPPRAMCRRANSAISRPAAIASTPNCCSQVPGLTGWTGRPSPSVWARLEGVGHPPGRVVHQDVHRPQVFLGRVEQRGRRRRVGQVGFHGQARPPTARIRSATGSAVVPGRHGRPARGPGQRVVHPQERAQHGAAALPRAPARWRPRCRDWRRSRSLCARPAPRPPPTRLPARHPTVAAHPHDGQIKPSWGF